MTPLGPVRYQLGGVLDVDAVIDLYRRSTLGERRPIDERDRMAQMIANANLTVTAWHDGALIGLARSMSDFAYATYLSDLAVDVAWQRRGIGVELMRRTRAEAPRAAIILLAAPAAVDYYPRVGFSAHPSAWILREGDEL